MLFFIGAGGCFSTGRLLNWRMRLGSTSGIDECHFVTIFSYNTYNIEHSVKLEIEI